MPCDPNFFYIENHDPSDIIVDDKPQVEEVEEDKWLMIQVKTTLKPGRDYGFKCNSSYKDCLVYCLCHSDKKMWIIDGNHIKSKNKIAIGLKKSKYDNYEVNVENITNIILKYYMIYQLYIFSFVHGI